MSAATSCSRGKRQPSLRVSFNQSHGSFDFGQELSTKTGLLGFVELHRLLEFQFGNGREVRFHFRKFFFRSEKTSAAGRAVSLPLS